MTKRMIAFILAIGLLHPSFAQTREEWQQQMEQLQQQMRELAEQFSKQFGNSQFFFDTTFVQPFEFRHFDGMPGDSAFVKRFEFHFDHVPFDTTVQNGFRLYGFSDGNGKMQWDTLELKEFKGFDGGRDLPGFEFDREWSKRMEQWMRQWEGFGQEFEGQPFYFREWKPKPGEEGMDQTKPAPRPAPRKKPKTTTI